MPADHETVFRLLTREEWESAQVAGRVAMSALDERDGFVHLSTASTMLETADRYFEASMKPVLLELDAGSLGSQLRWEVVESRDSQVFPHLYAPGIPVAAIRAVIVLEASAGGFVIGPRVEAAFGGGLLEK
jgi:uncharacterized protein (DUF952 family)